MKYSIISNIHFKMKNEKLRISCSPTTERQVDKSHYNLPSFWSK